MDSQEQRMEGQAVNALKEIALENLKERRRSRRWGIFFKLFFVLYLVVALVALVGGMSSSEDVSVTTASEITAVIDMKGVIVDGGDVSANYVIPSLRKAFKNKKTKGVILRINSPGGSPVQAGMINDEIQRLKKEYKDIPVYAVVSDICASGGYYIAVAAQEIYADKASIVGSIGVRMDNFGFVGLMEKLGVERRLLTAGENKGMLDPFLPANAGEEAHVKTMLSQTHQQFIDVVKAGRGDRLANNSDIFSGLFWTGEEAVKLGLVDGLANEYTIAKDKIGAETLVNFTVEKDFLERLGERVSASVKAWKMESQMQTPSLF